MPPHDLVSHELVSHQLVPHDPVSNASVPQPAAAGAPRARAFGTAVAYGRVARALHASPHTLAQLVRTVPASDEAARRANVWAALGAYFGWAPDGGAGPAAPPPRDYEV